MRAMKVMKLPKQAALPLLPRRVSRLMKTYMAGVTKTFRDWMAAKARGSVGLPYPSRMKSSVAACSRLGIIVIN